MIFMKSQQTSIQTQTHQLDWNRTCNFNHTNTNPWNFNNQMARGQSHNGKRKTNNITTREFQPNKHIHEIDRFRILTATKAADWGRNEAEWSSRCNRTRATRSWNEAEDEIEEQSCSLSSWIEQRWQNGQCAAIWVCDAATARVETELNRPKLFLLVVQLDH